MSEFQPKTTSRLWRTVNLGAVVAEAEEIPKKDNSAEPQRSFRKIRPSLRPSKQLAFTARYVIGVIIPVQYVRRRLRADWEMWKNVSPNTVAKEQYALYVATQTIGIGITIKRVMMLISV